MLFLKFRREEIKLQEENNLNNTAKSRRKNSGMGIFNDNTDVNIPKSQIDQTFSELDTVNNIIIFSEFLKEFISIIMHKFQFENTVENLFELYSLMLDEFKVNKEVEILNK